MPHPEQAAGGGQDPAQTTVDTSQATPAPAVASVAPSATARANAAVPGAGSAQSGARRDDAARSDDTTAAFAEDEDPSVRTARVYFGVQPMGEGFGTIEPWAPGETPILEAPEVADLDFKRPEVSIRPRTGSRPRARASPTRAR